MNVIKVEEIVSYLDSKGIHVVLLSHWDIKSTGHLKGDLDSFIAAAKLFNESIVFVQEFSLDEDDLFYKPDDPILGEYEQPSSEDGINLIQFLPALEEYKKYIGQTSFLIFRVFYQNKTFDYFHYAEWFEAFTELLEEAQYIYEEKEKVIKEQRERQQIAEREKAEQRENQLRDLLEDLAGDDKFISLKTQKAKQEYAVARYPELAELSQHILKDEISNLNARIEARKMLQ